MKKTISILAILFVLSACTGTISETEASKSTPFTGGKADYSIVTDQETGCQYIEGYSFSPSNGRAISLMPRLNDEGVPMCGK